MDKSLNGKQYNRAVHLHKCVYEALMRLLLKEFESSVQSLPTLNLEQLKLELNQEEFGRVLSSHEVPVIRGTAPRICAGNEGEGVNYRQVLALLLGALRADA